jgi:hypothetical protein
MRELLDLFKTKAASGDRFGALLLGQNMMSQHPGDNEAFDAYFAYLLSLAAKAESLDERQSILATASQALDSFAANAKLDEAVISYIKSCSQDLGGLQQKMLDERIASNEKALSLIRQLCSRGQSLTSRGEYEKCVSQIHEIDKKIKAEILTDEQARAYGELTQVCASMDAKKRAEFEDADNKQYNLDAVDTYRSVFEAFKSGTPLNMAELTARFFSFDSERLTQPTLVYYNYVYSYIFAKLPGDEARLALTIAAIKKGKK